MMNFRTVICMAMICMVAWGCDTTKAPVGNVNIIPEITKISGENDNISISANKIIDLASNGAQDVPELPYWSSIRTEASNIIKSTTVIDSAANILLDKSDNVSELNDRYGDSQAKIKELIAEKTSLSTKIYHLLGFTAAIGIIISIALFFFSIHKIAIPLAGASLTLLVLTFLLEAYMKWFLLGLGIVLLICIGVMVYQIVVHRRAVIDMFDGNEEARAELPDELDEKIYTNSDSIMNRVQTTSTKKLIKQVQGISHVTESK